MPSFLLLFVFLSSKCLTLSIPQETNPTTLLLGNDSVHGELNCYRNNPLSIGRPTTRDCISAIRRFPSGHIHGTFHDAMSRGDDQFRLPVSKSSGRCNVLIGLNSPASEDGTWLGLALAATQLITACADREGYLPRRGGWIDAGDNDGIRIVLDSTRRVFGMSGNATIGDEET